MLGRRAADVVLRGVHQRLRLLLQWLLLEVLRDRRRCTPKLLLVLLLLGLWRLLLLGHGESDHRRGPWWARQAARRRQMRAREGLVQR